MRKEPRWNPDLAAASQMKAEFFGRIMITGSHFEKSINACEMNELILGDGPQSLRMLSEFPTPYLPGPLEGSEDTPNPLPDEFSRMIEKQLNTDEAKPSSFFGLVNSAMIFKVTHCQAESAAKILRLANYRLANVENTSQLMGVLKGLASVAAVSRNPTLADELRILVRRYRCDSQYGFSVIDAVNICLIASSARADLIEWRDFVGEWLTELAFGKIEKDEGGVFHSRLLALLHSVPELWFSCSRAEAALKALNFR